MRKRDAWMMTRSPEQALAMARKLGYRRPRIVREGTDPAPFRKGAPTFLVTDDVPHEVTPSQ